jgi:hypothetical protein
MLPTMATPQVSARKTPKEPHSWPLIQKLAESPLAGIPLMRVEGRLRIAAVAWLPFV